MIKKILTFTIIISLVTLTGCWDHRPVDELGIISNITIEKTDNNRIRFNTIRPTFEKDKKQFSHNTTVEANTIMEALDTLQVRSSKTCLLGQVNNVLIGKDLAYDGISPILSQLDHLSDFKTQAYLAILKSTIEEMEIFDAPHQGRTGILIQDTLRASIKNQLIPETKFYEIMSIYSLKGREIALPVIKLNNKHKDVLIEGLAIFKGDKMVGEVSLLESIPYIIITAPKVNRLVINVPSEETQPYDIDKLSVTIRKRKIKVTTRIEDKVPIIHADIFLTVDEQSFTPSNPLDMESGKTIMDEKHMIEMMENIIPSYLEKQTEKLIDLTQREFESDIFGFGEKVRVQNNEYFKSINWIDEYPKAKITCSYKVNLRKIGTIK